MFGNLTVTGNAEVNRIVHPVKVDLTLRVDNTAAISWMNKGRAASFTGNLVTAKLRPELKLLRCIDVQYVKSADNIADAPSRLHTRRE
jgi:hypothetical protein